MFYSIICDTLKVVFNCRPMVVNEYERYIQVKYTLENIPSTTLYDGFNRLKHIYKGRYAVRVLFIYRGEMQVIIGDKEAIKPVGRNDSDFILEVC